MSAPLPTHVDGAHWMTNGQTVLSGSARAYCEQLDQHIVRFAGTLDATEYAFPPLLPVMELERVGYLRSFPHSATLAACVSTDDAELAAVADGATVDDAGAVRVGALAPLTEVLTPAACYHVYVHHQGAVFDRLRLFTTRNTCFRREAEYVPLERQWSFSMREVVCAGTGAEAAGFIAEGAAFMATLSAGLGLATDWQTATDSFYRPAQNPQAIMQMVDPTKNELVFDNRLALGSTNSHHDHFATAYGLGRTEAGRDIAVSTACVAFGLERWLSALGHTHGPDPSRWPVAW